MRRALGAAFQLFERERVHVELRDLVALAHEAEELAFGGGEGRIRHHVEQADVQFADVLAQRHVGRHHGSAFLLQAREGG